VAPPTPPTRPPGPPRPPRPAPPSGDLLEAYDGSLYWYACRFCSDDRGVERHIDGVVSRAPSRFRNHVAASAKCLIVGGL